MYAPNVRIFLVHPLDMRKCYLWGMVKGNKFGAKKVVNEYGTFDSIAEYGFFKKLRLLEQAEDVNERVVDIERQKVYECVINDIKCFKYKADFNVKYVNGTERVFDVKGYTGGASYSVFRVKQKCIEAQYGIKIELVINGKIQPKK